MKTAPRFHIRQTTSKCSLTSTQMPPISRGVLLKATSCPFASSNTLLSPQKNGTRLLPQRQCLTNKPSLAVKSTDCSPTLSLSSHISSRTPVVCRHCMRLFLLLLLMRVQMIIIQPCIRRHHEYTHSQTDILHNRAQGPR